MMRNLKLRKVLSWWDMKQDEIDASHLISYQLITTHILSPFPFPFPSNKNIESFDQYLCGGKLNTKLKKKKNIHKMHTGRDRKLDATISVLWGLIFGWWRVFLQQYVTWEWPFSTLRNTHPHILFGGHACCYTLWWGLKWQELGKVGFLNRQKTFLHLGLSKL